MSVEDRSGEIPGIAPTDSQDTPPNSNHSNSDADIHNVPINDQNNAANVQHRKPHEYPHWRSGLRKFYGFIPKRAEFWLAAFTFVLVVETALTIRVLSSTDKALHDTAKAEQGIRQITESTERAWLAPGNSEIISFPVIGQPAYVAVRFDNVGRSPADDIKTSVLFDTMLSPKDRKFNAVDPVVGDFCQQHPPSESFATQYPARTGTYFTDSRPVLWDKELSSDVKLLRMRVCLSYSALLNVHYMWWCNVFIEQHRMISNRTTGQPVAPVAQAEIITGFFRGDCRGGQGAR